MIRKGLKIGRWDVVFLFATASYDPEQVEECLYDMGATVDSVEEILDFISTCEWNCGFTLSNAGTYKALVVVGPTTSGEEFQNTFVHELHHLAVAIAEELGVDLEGETPAYIAGDSMLELSHIVCQLGCSLCN